jgi:uncharacterized membrane protein
MAFSRSLRHHSLRASEVLPFFDGVFAVAFTLLAFNLPDRLVGAMASARLSHSLAVYALAALTVIIYWFKLRRLVLVDRLLQPPQLLLVGIGLLIIVLLPRLASLVLQHGVGAGNLLHWTLPQIVNTLCLSMLLLLNLVCLLYARSLLGRLHRRGRQDRLLSSVVHAQGLGMLALSGLLVLELSFTWFDNQYFFLLPFLLLAEEAFLSHWILL